MFEVLASRLRIPDDRLAAGRFRRGALTSDVNPQRLLGPAFQPLVSLSVAVILYDAGRSLDMRVKGHTRKVVIRLIVLGVLITWVLAASSAAPLLGMFRRRGGDVLRHLVVSGLTVVVLLQFVRAQRTAPAGPHLEGSLIDPVGGDLGALVFHAVIARPTKDRAASLCNLRPASASAWPEAWPDRAALGCLLRRRRLGEVLGTTAQLAAVIAAGPALLM